jgi:hypothetical protein
MIADWRDCVVDWSTRLFRWSAHDGIGNFRGHFAAVVISSDHAHLVTRFQPLERGRDFIAKTADFGPFLSEIRLHDDQEIERRRRCVHRLNNLRYSGVEQAEISSSQVADGLTTAVNDNGYGDTED